MVTVTLLNHVDDLALMRLSFFLCAWSKRGGGNGLGQSRRGKGGTAFDISRDPVTPG